MSESKSNALPLGYIPKNFLSFLYKARVLYKKWCKVKKYFTFLTFCLVFWAKIFLTKTHMMKLLSLLMKRPKDKTIYMILIIFWIILIASSYYNLIFQWDAVDNKYLFFTVPAEFLIFIKYFIVALWAIPLYIGLTKQCLLKKKHMRIFQAFFGVLLWYVAANIVETWRLDLDEGLFLLAFGPIFAWATWKLIASSCLRYKEKIQKIRV